MGFSLPYLKDFLTCNLTLWKVEDDKKIEAAVRMTTKLCMCEVLNMFTVFGQMNPTV